MGIDISNQSNSRNVWYAPNLTSMFLLIQENLHLSNYIQFSSKIIIRLFEYLMVALHQVSNISVEFDIYSQVRHVAPLQRHNILIPKNWSYS
jgi:hypothetical protein